MLSEIHVSPGWDEKSRGLFMRLKMELGLVCGRSQLSLRPIMSSQLLRSLSRLWERERESSRGWGSPTGHGERKWKGWWDSETHQTVTVWWEDQYESLSLLLSSGAQLPGQPMWAPLSAGRHRAAREEKMKPASWREVRETASNTLSLCSLSPKTSGVACSLICPSNISTQEERDCRHSAKTKENHDAFFNFAFLCPYVPFNSFIGMIKYTLEMIGHLSGGEMSRDL